MTDTRPHTAERSLPRGALRDAPYGASAAAPCSRISAKRTPPRSSGHDGHPCDAGNVRNLHTPDGEPATVEWIIARLEEAGATLLSLPHTGYSTRLRVGALRPVLGAEDMLHAAPNRPRAPTPSAAGVDRMDQALAWVPLIPESRIVLRRIVHARALVSPMTGKHLFAWRRLAVEVGADHKAVQRWHAQGIDIIVAALNIKPT